MSPLTLYNILTETLTLSSPAFYHNGTIPEKYGCQGLNINPALNIGDIPGKTKSLALIVEDPDAEGKTFDHWLVWNIPVIDTIREDSIPGIEGTNGNNEIGYSGALPANGSTSLSFQNLRAG